MIDVNTEGLTDYLIKENNRENNLSSLVLGGAGFCRLSVDSIAAIRSNVKGGLNIYLAKCNKILTIRTAGSEEKKTEYRETILEIWSCKKEEIRKAYDENMMNTISSLLFVPGARGEKEAVERLHNLFNSEGEATEPLTKKRKST
jgi:hypothetical protein